MSRRAAGRLTNGLALDLGDGSLQLGGEARRTDLEEHLHQLPVVPEDVGLLLVEALPELVTVLPQVRKDRARVVKLVRRRDQMGGRRGDRKMRDELLLAVSPGRPGPGVRVGASLDDRRDGRPEALADVL